MAAKCMIIPILLLVFPLICYGFSPDNPTDQHLLVLLDDLAIRSSHSIFFKSLTDRGYELDFKLAHDPKLALQRYGKYLYDGLIIFAPSADGLGGSLDLSAVLDFVDSGHDLILAADTTTSDVIRDIAAECGVDFDENPAAVVIDHTSYAVTKTESDHTLIVSDDVIDSRVILGEKKLEAPVLFRGIAHSLNPANSLVLKVLSASPSAYSANPKVELSTPPALVGSSISLVSVVQARNNARILVSGSLDLFSNKFFRSQVQKFGSSVVHAKSGNEQFVAELSKWVFHERGHLKAVNVQHHKVGETGEPAMYRIGDHLEYSVEIYEWTGKDWKPSAADDVQVQFYMMSPYVLKTLSHNNKAWVESSPWLKIAWTGLYSTSFQVPDVYGVFQFKIEYQRLGYTSLSLSKQIPVRPFRHNEYERFITAAYPYYGGAFSMMAGFFIFGIVFLYHK